MVKTVFAEKDRDHARWREVADSLCSKLHSTNPPERVNKEIKRRINVAGKFADREAVIRLVGALMLERKDEWAVSHRFMPVEKLTAMCTDAKVAKIIVTR
ncbi:MAG: transposase [Roseovarius sp.]|nr:transposase [Roseovarius sp.]